ncbi:hypothetical protein PybrP1_004874 [[Pythium] brassicae (nom. inval.)]|nr:hypothetical protein PybrP1_004874 [[Pythium] brassicae (nom. inval.)]
MASCSAPSSATSTTSSSTASSSAPLSASLLSPEWAGVLRVDVLSAQNLPPAILGSLLKWTSNYSNPYAVVSLAGQQFTSSAQDKTLNPTWKEHGELLVPLPSEQEVVQSMGGSGSAVAKKASSDMHALAAGKLGGGSSGAAWAAKHAGDPRRRHFSACSPELLVQVFHRVEAGKAAAGGAAAGAGGGAVPEPPEDKLLGSVVVPLLPCLMSSLSSHRAWYALLDDDSRDAGQIQLALHFDVGGMAPIKGDHIRLAGFGGMEYYAKVVPAGVRLEVTETYQDQVLATYKSIEGWALAFEFHRNLVHVVHRPSILREAHTQLHGQITRVRDSRVLKKAKNVWLALPETPRRQAAQTYEFTVFSGALLYEVLAKGVTEALEHGVRYGVVACRTSGGDALGKVKDEFVRIYWTNNVGGWVPETVDELLDCGTRRARGKIYAAFTVEDLKALEPDSEEGKGGLGGYDEDEEEEEDDDDEFLDDVCPEQLICPITGCPMADPVVAADGHTYEREAILHWFSTSDISPLTGTHIPTTQVFPNFTLRKLSEEFQLARRRTSAARRR